MTNRKYRDVNPDDPLRQMNVRVPSSLLAAVDERRALRRQSRDEWTAKALAYVLKNTPAIKPEDTP